MLHEKMERVTWWQKEQWETQGPPGQESGAGLKFGWGRGAPHPGGELCGSSFRL